MVGVAAFVTLLAFSIATTAIVWLGAGSDRGWWPVHLAVSATAAAIFSVLFDAAVRRTRLGTIRNAVAYAAVIGAVLVVQCVLFYWPRIDWLAINEGREHLGAVQRFVHSRYAVYGTYVFFLLLAFTWARWQRAARA